MLFAKITFNYRLPGFFMRLICLALLFASSLFAHAEDVSDGVPVFQFGRSYCKGVDEFISKNVENRNAIALWVGGYFTAYNTVFASNNIELYFGEADFNEIVKNSGLVRYCQANDTARIATIMEQIISDILAAKVQKAKVSRNNRTPTQITKSFK